MDIAVELKTGVVAVRSGIVTEVRVSKTLGNCIKFQTDDGYIILYAHLDSVAVKVGEYVEKGHTVAYSGNSGLSTGAHLHYSVWKDGELVDPMIYVDLPRTIEVDEEYRQRQQKSVFVNNK